MVVDSSALLAVVFREAERPLFLDVMLDAGDLTISAANVIEADVVAVARLGAQGDLLVDDVINDLGLRIVPVDSEQLRLARRAFREFGKGRHPAGLNFGDLFAYALSKAAGEPLLFKGDDFRKTDIEPAL